MSTHARSVLIAVAVVLASPVASAQTEKPQASCASPERTLSLDVIELSAGREVPGREQLAVLHDGVAYLFSTEANRDRFAKDPRAFEVADGGACGPAGGAACAVAIEAPARSAHAASERSMIRRRGIGSSGRLLTGERSRRRSATARSTDRR